MTSQQLIEARAALWHHNAEPILTLEAATSWVATTGFLLFLPRRQQLRAPSPTFVEATMGRLEHTPGRPEIENALSIARRLFDTGEAFPLNLLGALNEEPDFVIARDRLPWLLSLRGDRSWKTAPGGRTTPLNISVWKLLDEQGELTAGEIRSGVGRDVSEASVRRALIDLWGTLRVFPRYHDGDTTWALAKTLCPRECAKGATTSQGAALSLFLADYLRSAIAATEDEIASFLSPLASRSRLREVLHALTATRQLSTIPLGPNTLYYVAGELPEFPEIAPPESVDEAAAPSDQEQESVSEHASPAPQERIHKYTPRTESREPYQRRQPYERSDRPQRDFRRSGPERSGSDRPAARGDFKPRRQDGGYNRPFRDNREGREDRPQRREGGFKPRTEGGFKPRTEGGFKPRREGGFKPRTEGGFKPRREGGFKSRTEGGFKPRAEGGFRPPARRPRPESDSAESGRPEHTSRPGQEDRSRPPFRKKFSGDQRHKPFGRKFQDSGDRKPYGDRKRPDQRSRDFRSRDDRPGQRPDFRKNRDSDDRPRRDEGSSDRPPRKNYGKPGGFSRPGGKPFGKGPGKKFGKPSGSGPGKSFGKGGGKSGYGKGSGKNFGKSPGKGFSKGPKRGPGKPRRSE